jgi:hypothetical protein
VIRKSARCLPLTLLAYAAPAAAGVVYVPLPGVETVGDAQWQPTVVVANSAAAEEEFQRLFLAADTDGTDRASDPATQPLGAGLTTSLAPANEAGLLELEGPDPVAFSAKLVRSGDPDSAGVYLPVLSSENLFAAGDVAAVQGIRRGETVATDWLLVNLGHGAAQCTLRSFGRTGGLIGAAVTVPMPPLALRRYADFLDMLGIGLAGTVRVEATCNQPFYTFALTRDAANGEVAFLGPSGKGDSTLRLPGEEGCPAEAACFAVPGVVHSPTVARPVQRITFPVPPGNYRRIHYEMDVTHGGWFDANPAGLHMLFWLVKNRNFYMYGYGNFQGPNNNRILFRHGVELTHPEKIKILKPFAAQPGHTYHLDYTYDTELDFLELVVSEGGEERARVRGTPNVGEIAVAPGDVFHIDIGFIEGNNPGELPTYGWVYRDIAIEFIR